MASSADSVSKCFIEKHDGSVVCQDEVEDPRQHEERVELLYKECLETRGGARETDHVSDAGENNCSTLKTATEVSARLCCSDHGLIKGFWHEIQWLALGIYGR